jgi:hypothetical protein
VKRWKRTRQSAPDVGISGKFDLATPKQVSSAGTVKWDNPLSSNTGTRNVSLGRESSTEILLLNQSTKGREFSPVIVNVDTPTVSIRSISKSLSLLVK